MSFQTQIISFLLQNTIKQLPMSKNAVILNTRACAAGNHSHDIHTNCTISSLILLSYNSLINIYRVTYVIDTTLNCIYLKTWHSKSRYAFLNSAFVCFCSKAGSACACLRENQINNFTEYQSLFSMQWKWIRTGAVKMTPVKSICIAFFTTHKGDMTFALISKYDSLSKLPPLYSSFEISFICMSRCIVPGLTSVTSDVAFWNVCSKDQTLMSHHHCALDYSRVIASIISELSHLIIFIQSL